jgi:hypothetical protein
LTTRCATGRRSKAALYERPGQAQVIQQFDGARVDGERAQLGGSVLVAVDDAHLQAVTRQLGRHQQAGRPGPDDERVHGRANLYDRMASSGERACSPRSGADAVERQRRRRWVRAARQSTGGHEPSVEFVSLRLT